MALDESTSHPTTANKVVYFGGCCDVNHHPLGGTYYWDGAQWVQLQIAGPCNRTSTRMAWDPATGDLLLFGGTAGPGCGVPELTPLNDTWLFNGQTWTACQSCTTPPPARASEGMATDEDAGNVVLFGGNTAILASGPEEALGPVVPNGETWLFNGSPGMDDGTWTQKFPTSPPCSRSSPGMAWDGATGRHKVVLFGGQGTGGPGCSGGLYNDTWTWNATQARWVPCQTNCGTPPSARYVHRMSWDPAIGSSGLTVMFGGATGDQPGQLLQDTWTIDGSWAPCGGVCLSTAPFPRCCVGLAYAPGTGLLLYGGQFYDQNGHRIEAGDTWYFDGTQWHCLLGC